MKTFRYINNVVGVVQSWRINLKRIMLALIFLTLSLSGQSYDRHEFSVDELIGLARNSYDDFDTAVVEKGYMFYTSAPISKEDSNVQMHVYKLISNSQHVMLSYAKTKKSIAVAVDNPSTNYYSKIKKNLKAKGFKLDLSSTGGNGNAFSYTKNDIRFLLLTQNPPNSNYPTYIITACVYF